MSYKLYDECASRVQHGVPLRLDQTAALMGEGFDAGMVEQSNDPDEDRDLSSCYHCYDDGCQYCDDTKEV